MDSKRAALPKITEQTKATWQRVRHDHSAGGVAYRLNDATAQIEVALIATRGGTRWQLPKGSRESAETPLETAIREVEEEVGLQTAFERFLKSIDYWYWDTYRKETAELVHKSVDFYLLTVTGGVLSDACYEVDAVGWFTLDEAEAMLSFEGELQVLQMARPYLQSR